MKKILVLLLALSLFLPLIPAQADTYVPMWSYRPLEDQQLKDILADPKTDKTQGLPNQLEKAVGKKEADKKIQSLYPQGTNSKLVLDPSLYPSGWDPNTYTPHASLEAALAHARAYRATYGYYPSEFYFYTSGLLYRGNYSSTETAYNLYYYNGTTWTWMLAVKP